MRGAFFWALIIIALFVVSMCMPELAHPRANKYPPNYSVYVRIAQCEQPAPLKYQKKNGRWPADMKWGVWWKQTHNYTFPGGAGMQTVLWEAHRRPHMKHTSTMDKAPISEQLWAMHRFYLWAEKTYPGYGFTGWDCARKDWFK
jgi:hypothetical protein